MGALAVSAEVSARSLDHLIRSRQQRRRDGEAEGFGGLEVNHQLELARLLYWQIARFGTLQDTVDVAGGSAEHLGKTWPIGDQASVPEVVLGLIESRQPMSRRPNPNLRAVAIHERVR